MEVENRTKKDKQDIMESQETQIVKICRHVGGLKPNVEYLKRLIIFVHSKLCKICESKAKELKGGIDHFGKAFSKLIMRELLASSKIEQMSKVYQQTGNKTLEMLL